MISRRQFLIGAAGAAAGLILPDWLVRAERYVEEEGTAYLEAPEHLSDTLYAVDWGDGNFQLFLGDPQQDVPDLTWREFADRYFGMAFDEFVVDHLGMKPREAVAAGILEEGLAPEWNVLDQWVYHDSPSALAFSYLDNLDLGPDFGRAGGAGQIDFIDGPAPGNDSRIVSVPDHLSLSLLQKRLNDLREGVRVFVG
jgi:hypothetical protein